MKENDKNIEHLIDKMMNEGSLQSPSIDFTSRVMHQVLVVESSKIKAYKPLISKGLWFLIIGSLIAISYYSIMTSSNDNLKINKIYTQKIYSLFSGFKISKISLYTMLIVPLMILIQIPILKKYYYKKYQL